MYKYTWQYILFTVKILLDKKILSESQKELICDLINSINKIKTYEDYVEIELISNTYYNIYTWQHLLFTADILMQRGILTESEIILIIDIVDLKTIVRNNLLSDKFIEDEIIPRIDWNEYDGLDLYKINSYQSYMKYRKESL
jgi:hypothetical protein